MRVTIFKNVYDKPNPHHLTIQQALSRIRDGKSSTTISDIRDGEKEKKKQLPVVCWSGEFAERSDDALFEHSGLIVLDFDHVDVDSTKTSIATDNYVHSCWTSPSGNGVKALVKITNPERHRDHFRALVKYFERQYGLQVDESGINESRACFESHDPEIIIKDVSEKFGALLSENVEHKEKVSVGGDHTDYMRLNLAARMIRHADDGDKHATLLRAAKLCGGYVAAGRRWHESCYARLASEI